MPDLSPENVLLDPEKALRELGETPVRSGGDAARTAMAGVNERFCGGCWATLPQDAASCPDCGRSVAEMEAQRQAKLAADHNWVPPRRQEKAEAVSSPTFQSPESPIDPPVVGPSVPDPLAQEFRKSRQHFLMAVLVGSAWGGAVMVAAWFTIKNLNSTPKPPEPEPTVVSANAPTAANTPAVEVYTRPLCKVNWQNPYQEIRLELYSATDKQRVAREGEGTQVQPGVYLVRIKPKDSDWQISGGTVKAELGKPVNVTVTPQHAGRFFLELGDRYDGIGKTDKAIGAWELAVETDPKLIKAHLRLASALAVHNRYREARRHADAVLAADPRNVDALEIKRILDELDKLQ